MKIRILCFICAHTELCIQSLSWFAFLSHLYLQNTWLTGISICLSPPHQTWQVRKMKMWYLFYSSMQESSLSIYWAVNLFPLYISLCSRTINSNSNTGFLVLLLLFAVVDLKLNWQWADMYRRLLHFRSIWFKVNPVICQPSPASLPAFFSLEHVIMSIILVSGVMLKG